MFPSQVLRADQIEVDSGDCTLEMQRASLDGRSVFIVERPEESMATFPTDERQALVKRSRCTFQWKTLLATVLLSGAIFAGAIVSKQGPFIAVAVPISIIAPVAVIATPFFRKVPCAPWASEACYVEAETEPKQYASGGC